jgi:hypothetical protein
LSRGALLSPEILRGRLVFNDNCRALGGRGVGGGAFRFVAFSLVSRYHRLPSDRRTHV